MGILAIGEHSGDIKLGYGRHGMYKVDSYKTPSTWHAFNSQILLK